MLDILRNMRTTSVLNKVAGRMVVLTTLATMGAMANAQLLDLASSRDGTGSINFGSRSGNLSVGHAKVSLNRNGTAEIQLSNGSDELFRGTWRNMNDRTIRFDIQKLVNDHATGTGTISHDSRGNFTSVALSGQAGRRRFSFDFRASERVDQRSIRSVREGSGSVNFVTRSTATSRINRLEAIVNPNGEFEVRALSGASVRVTGRWRQLNPRELELEVRAMDDAVATGSGRLQLDGRGSFDRVTISADQRRTVMNLEFGTGAGAGNSGGYGRPPAHSVEDMRFIDSARAELGRKFSRGTRLIWSEEKVGPSTFGNRTVTGFFRAEGGDAPGEYRYSVVLGAGTATAHGVSYSRR